MYKLYYEVAPLMFFQQILHQYFIVDTDLPINDVLLDHVFTCGDVKGYAICFYKSSINLNFNLIKDFSTIESIDYNHFLKIDSKLKTLKSTGYSFYGFNEILSDLDLILLNWMC